MSDTGAPAGPGLNEDERAELARLRAELAAYQQQDRGSGPPGPAGRTGRGGWRSVAAIALIVVGCLLMPVSVVGIWARNQVTNTDRYIANVTPLAADPGVQSAIADRITNEVFNYIDLDAIIDEAVAVLVARGLPPATADRLRGLAGPLANGVRGFVRGKVGEVVASDTFQDAWVTANRVAHEQLVAALSGEGTESVSVSEGKVSIGLGAFITAAKQSLVDSGFGAARRIPDINPQFELLSSRDLARAQDAYRLLERLGTVLPFVAIGLILLGVYVAPGHRRALVGAGLGVAASMLLLGIVLAILRTSYLDRLPENVSATAAATVFDTLIRFVRDGLRTVLVVGLVVAAAAFVSGPSTTAVRTRQGVIDGVDWLRARGESAGLQTGPVGRWAHANLKVLRVAVIAIGALVFVFLDRPSGGDVLLLAILVVVALVVLQFLGGGRRQAAAEGGVA